MNKKYRKMYTILQACMYVCPSIESLLQPKLCYFVWVEFK